MFLKVLIESGSGGFFLSFYITNFFCICRRKCDECVCVYVRFSFCVAHLNLATLGERARAFVREIIYAKYN